MSYVRMVNKSSRNFEYTLNISSHHQNCKKVMIFFKTAVCVFVSGLPTWHFFVKLDRWHVIGAVPIG